MTESLNRSHRIEVLLGRLGTAIIVFAFAFYISSEPDRIVDSQGETLFVQLDDAMTLYAENCAVCHGLNGEGIGATPPLNATGLQTMPYKELYKVIAHGRFETAMPAWGDRMTDAEIQAIVGFLCQWEATAPEAAQPMGPPSSMGGPPWLRNQVTVTPVPDTGTTLVLNAAVAETPFPPG